MHVDDVMKTCAKAFGVDLVGGSASKTQHINFLHLCGMITDIQTIEQMYNSNTVVVHDELIKNGTSYHPFLIMTPVSKRPRLLDVTVPQQGSIKAVVNVFINKTKSHFDMFVVSGHLYRPLLLSQSWELGGKI